jgi:hypothetical protein
MVLTLSRIYSYLSLVEKINVEEVFFSMEEITGNPLSTYLHFVDGK